MRNLGQDNHTVQYDNIQCVNTGPSKNSISQNTPRPTNMDATDYTS